MRQLTVVVRKMSIIYKALSQDRALLNNLEIFLKALMQHFIKNCNESEISGSRVPCYLTQYFIANMFANFAHKQKLAITLQCRIRHFALKYFQSK